MTYRGLVLGQGKPLNLGDYQNIKESLKLYYFGSNLFNISVWLVKYSALLFYARLFRNDAKFKKALWICAGITTLWSSIVLTSIFECTVCRLWLLHSTRKLS